MKRPLQRCRAMLPRAAAALAGLALLLPVRTATAQEQTIAFHDVHVVTMQDEGVRRNQTVLVRNGRIVEIGKADDVTIPAEAQLISAAGKYLMPGLAEMHAHIPTPAADGDETLVKETLFLYLANGITTIRGMLGHPYHLALRQRVHSGELLGPRIYTSGPSLNGRSAPTAAVAREMVQAQQLAGYDFLKLHPGLSLQVFEAIVEAARAADITFAGHVSTAVGVRRALAAGYASIDHLDGYVEALVPDSAAVDPGEGGFFGFNFTDLADSTSIAGLAAATRAAGVWVVPTQSLLERWVGPADPDTLAREPEMGYVPPEMVASWVARKKQMMATASYDTEKAQRFIELRRAIIRGLLQADAGLLLGSDAPQVFNVPGFSIHHELGMLVAAGLTPYQALRSGTLNPALFFNAAGEFGTIREGAVADLILLDGNPLEDVAHLQQRAGVMVRGRWLSAEELALRLGNLASKYRQSN